MFFRAILSIALAAQPALVPRCTTPPCPDAETDEPIGRAPPARPEAAEPARPAVDDEVAPRRKEGPESAPSSDCFEDDDAFNRRRWGLMAGLLGGGLGLTLIGTAVIFGTREEIVDQPVTFRDCPNSQPCGNSCISWDKECHIDDPPANSNPREFRYPRPGVIASSVLFSAGFVLLVLGFALPPSLKPKRLKCTAHGCGLVLRF